jgi:hypothetical protein
MRTFYTRNEVVFLTLCQGIWHLRHLTAKNDQKSSGMRVPAASVCWEKPLSVGYSYNNDIKQFMELCPIDTRII